MKQTKRNIVAMQIIMAVWLVLAVWAWLRPSTETSVSERRELQQFPELSVNTVMDGSFAEKFESYTLDQFPARDGFRRLKAGFHYGVLRQKDNNGIYLSQGYAAQLEYPLNEKSVDHALQVFRGIWESYLQDAKVYLSIIPDKSYFLAEEGGYPAMDYSKLENKMKEGMSFADYVNLKDLLSIQHYYRTDTHWRQETLTQAAQRLCGAMGAPWPENWQFSARAVEKPFYGVYYGQAALPMEPEVLYTMESDLLADCRVFNYETGSYAAVYDPKKLEGKDLYEVYLSGPVSLLTVENPHATTERELIIFRDSFGSSIAPLLVPGYKSVTLVDVRYVPSNMLGRFLDFHGQDVLFLYSTLVLNNSSQLK